jgi:hypothetical protein
VLLVRLPVAQGTPTAAASVRREQAESFIAAELERTAPASAATRYRSLRQLFKWLEDEARFRCLPMAEHGR